jgi:hypothetical protein
MFVFSIEVIVRRNAPQLRLNVHFFVLLIKERLP